MGSLLSPYDERWAREFEHEAERLRAALKNRATRIEHVGSTSVPGLTAKPIIDIQISIAELVPLEFREWLRSHPDDREAYAALKLRLARDADPDDPLSVIRYTERKGDFVRRIESKTREA